MNNKWFEMGDLIKKDYDESTWIPLLSFQTLDKAGKISFEGYREEIHASVAILFPVEKKAKALELSWSDVNVGQDNRPYANQDAYMLAGQFEHYEDHLRGEYLVLRRFFDYSDENPEWHLSQDLVLGLGLLRKGDSWLLPAENYSEIARLIKNEEGRPERIEIKAEHLKDYLAARKSGILLSRFHSRREMASDYRKIGWCKEDYRQDIAKDNYRWEGRCYAIHEGDGSPWGSQIAVFHVSRSDVDFNEDVPTFGVPTDENVKSKSKTVGLKGKKIYNVLGDLWKTDWINPGQLSPRVRGDRIESKIPFVIDNEGSTLCSKELEESGRYLWFKPTIVNVILDHQKAVFGWYTEDTGVLGLMGRGVHFGVNAEGFLCVYAKDIALLPEMDKKIWYAHNMSPEGGVSKELLQSQQEALPANTKAPEKILSYSLNELERTFLKKVGKKLFRSHDKEDEILTRIHRFQATNLKGIYILAKELTRFVIERLDYDLLKSLTSKLPSDARSLKRLEKILNNYGLKGYELLGPLVGIYELRKGDAHLPAGDFQEAIKLIGINIKDDEKNYINAGKEMISAVSKRLYIIAKLISET